MSPWLHPDRYRAELTAAVDVVADVVRATDPAHPVPTCPGWTMADLARHVGVGLAWAAALVRERATVPVPQSTVLVPAADEYAAWVVDSAAALVTAVAEAGPEAPVWSWTPERTAGFWLRRLAHDVLVHQLDAELAVDRAPRVAADLAADGVSDLLNCIAVLSAYQENPVFDGLRGDGQTLHFHTTDPDLGDAGEWFVRRTPDGVEWEHGHRKGDVAARGPALDLLLVLNRRATPDRLHLAGDADLFAHWWEHSAF